WQAALDLARDLAERARQTSKKDVKIPGYPFMTFPAFLSDRQNDGVYARRVATIGFSPADSIGDSLAVYREKIFMTNHITGSIVFTNGSVSVLGKNNPIAEIENSVIFC